MLNKTGQEDKSKDKLGEYKKDTGKYKENDLLKKMDESLLF